MAHRKQPLYGRPDLVYLCGALSWAEVQRLTNTWRLLMKSTMKLAVTLVAGLTTGGAAIHVLYAQGTAPSYVVTEIEEITDAAAFSVVTQRPQAEAAARVQQGGGRYVTRT